MGKQQMWRALGRFALACGFFAVPLLAAGCNGFFVCQKSSCTTTTTGTSATSSGDYAYVTNSASSTSSLAAYDLSTGSPVALAGSPYSLGFVPSAIAVAPGNALLFLTSPVSGGVYAYTLAASGVPTIAHSGTAVGDEPYAVGMDISADGKYLFVLSEVTLTGAVSVDEYSITDATGDLQLEVAAVPSPLNSLTAQGIKVAPSGDFVVVAEGTAGDAIFPLKSELLQPNVSVPYLPLTSGTVGDFGVTVDSSDDIYFSRTGMIAAYTATSAGQATLITNTSTNSATGAGDHGIALSTTGAFLYTANTSATAATVSGFSNNKGTLGALNTSGFSAPNSITTVAADNSGKYLVAAGVGSGAVVEYAISSGGLLTASSTTASTGAGVTLLAVTH